MRLIDADETRKNLDIYLKKIHNHSINTVSKYGKEMFEVTENAIRGCIDIVNLIPTVNQWIPCSERLPEEDGRYLCVFQGMSVETCWFERGHFRIYGEIKDKLITAWMPLPKPYEVKE